MASKPSRYVVASVLLAVLAVVAGLFVPLSEAAREPASLPRISSGVSSISATASKVETGSISKGDEQDDLGRSIYAERFAKASAAERMCLARAVYYEARGEAMDGQIAVAQTVLNRARSKHWPNTICGVVNQGVERGEKCQFSFACFKHLSEPGGETWEQAQLVAEQALAGQAWLRELIEATHYHATGVAPVWRSGLSEIKTIGTHVFYRDGDGLKANALGAQDYEAAAAKQLVNTKVEVVTKKARPKPIPGEAAVAAPSRRGDDWRANVFAQ